MSKNVLSNKGKDKLLKAFENLIDAKIAQWVTGKSGPDEEEKALLDKARKEMKESLYALEIELC